jgi:hypothetical protein
MATLEEVVVWSLDEIRGGICELLPAGWVFEEDPVGQRAARVRLLRPGEEGPQVEWEDTHHDLRLLLLGAYGHLWLRQHQVRPDSPWVRRHNPTREAVTRQVLARFPRVPDPADVDPSEVQAVYETTRKKT